MDCKKRSFDLILTENILDGYKEVLNRLRIRAAHTFASSGNQAPYLPLR